MSQKFCDKKQIFIVNSIWTIHVDGHKYHIKFNQTQACGNTCMFLNKFNKPVAHSGSKEHRSYLWFIILFIYLFILYKVIILNMPAYFTYFRVFKIF